MFNEKLGPLNPKPPLFFWRSDNFCVLNQFSVTLFTFFWNPKHQNFGTVFKKNFSSARALGVLENSNFDSDMDLGVAPPIAGSAPFPKCYTFVKVV
jgi:hypothetical protein